MTLMDFIRVEKQRGKRKKMTEFKDVQSLSPKDSATQLKKTLDIHSRPQR